MMVKTREPHKQQQKVQMALPGQSPAVHCERERCKYQGFTAAAGRNPRLLIQLPSTSRASRHTDSGGLGDL